MQQRHESCSRPIAIGGNSSSTRRWNGVPRGTMDEVSSPPYALLWLRLFEAGPSLTDSCRRLSGFGKSGIGACSATCEQFHEFGVQSIAARRGERVKRKKRHVGPLGQHVILRRNVLPASAIFQPARHSITPLLALKSKKARVPATRRMFRYRSKKRSLRLVHADYPLRKSLRS